MRKTATVLLIIALLAPAGGLGGCTTTQPRYVRDGREYGVTRGLFRHRWWNYYERGISFSEGAFFDEAISDFDAAISQREEDQWRSRTYGMHFVDYFPHRELGVVYYRLGRHEDAVRELETSLAGADSAKAKFFLNKARAEVLKKAGTDTGAPEVSLSAPRDGAITNSFNLALEGVAEDDTFVAAVRVNGKALPFELAAPRLPFATELPLEEGENRIIVAVEDLLGNVNEKTVVVTADRSGPVISLSEIQKTGAALRIQGYVADSSGVQTLKVNGAPVSLGDPAGSEFTVTATGDSATIEAEDVAGNVTVATIPDSREARPLDGLPVLASNEIVPIGSRLTRCREQGCGKDVPVQYALSLSGLVDTQPPSISVKELADEQKVFSDRVLVEGSVSDDSTIKSLSVNGEDILRKEGKKVFFSHLQGLQVGGNVIEIEARDTLGNNARRAVSVQREEQKVHQLGSRLSLAVLPLEHQGENSVIGNAVYDAFISAVVNQGRFDLVERTKVEEVLRELKLSATDLVDPETAAKAGRLVAAEALVAGTVVETNKAIEVIARFIDTETSLVLAANDVFDEDKSLRAVMGLMDRLAYKFGRDFPLVEGLVIEAKNGEIMVDLGTQHRLKKNLRLILFREGEPVRHPITGKILGADTEELGEAQVTAVFDEFSKAEVIRKEGTLKVLDKVITK